MTSVAVGVDPLQHLLQWQLSRMNDRYACLPPPVSDLMPKTIRGRHVNASVRVGFAHQLSELTTQLSETIGLAEARAKDEGRLRSELKRLQITAARWVVMVSYFVVAIVWCPRPDKFPTTTPLVGPYVHWLN